MAKKGGRAAKAVEHAVAKEEENFIWKACNGIFRPVKSDAFKDAEKAAERKGKKLADPRAGLPTHASEHPRLNNKQQEEAAGDLGYSRVNSSESRKAKEPIYHNPDRDPPYISQDHTGHGANDPSLPPGAQHKVSWKGADSAKDLAAGRRKGTYVPEYRGDGGIDIVRKRN